MYLGIAFCGKKGAGKDLLTDHFCKTRLGSMVYRCKEPIVSAYEKLVGHPYEKIRDDAELIKLSRDVIRKENDKIVAKWLFEEVQVCINIGGIPVIPDLRRVPEWTTLTSLQILCVKIEASEETRRLRINDREGSLANYDPNDSTESDVDLITCPYVVDNDKQDDGAYAFRQLESYLSRQGPLFQCQESEYVQ